MILHVVPCCEGTLVFAELRMKPNVPGKKTLATTTDRSRKSLLLLTPHIFRVSRGSHRVKPFENVTLAIHVAPFDM
jgi:hypothetical protein